MLISFINSTIIVFDLGHVKWSKYVPIEWLNFSKVHWMEIIFFYLQLYLACGQLYRKIVEKRKNFTANVGNLLSEILNPWKTMTIRLFNVNYTFLIEIKLCIAINIKRQLHGWPRKSIKTENIRGQFSIFDLDIHWKWNVERRKSLTSEDRVEMGGYNYVNDDVHLETKQCTHFTFWITFAPKQLISFNWSKNNKKI